jgi:hypothetical protein
MCKKLIDIFKNLSFKKDKNTNIKGFSKKLEDKKANKKFYDDMETGVMDDDF